jgi:hypothetical protein
MYAVEKHVPIPASATRGDYSPKYNWDRLKEVGDSIFVPESEVPEGKDLQFLRQRVYQAARKYASGKGKKFLALVVEETRANPKYVQPGLGVEDNGEPVNIIVRGVRVWLDSIDESPTTSAATGPTGAEMVAGEKAIAESVNG